MKSRTLIITHRANHATIVAIIRNGNHCSDYTPTTASLLRVAKLVNEPKPQPGHSLIPWHDGVTIAYTM